MANNSPRQRSQLLDNIIWMGASIFLATIVWITAELNTNPITEVQLTERIEIEVLVNEDMVLTSQPNARVFVTLRAQESTFDTPGLAESVRVVADSSDINEAGQHRITLEGTVEGVGQVSVVEVVPTQINVQLAQRAERLVQLRTVIVGEPSASLAVDFDEPEQTQILIAGPAERVALVDEAQLQMDLSGQRETVELVLEPILINLEQGEIQSTNITTDPESITIAVDIEPRSDVREVRVSPNFVNELPEGYTITSSFTIQPETAFVSGPPETLENLPSTFSTEPIDLSQYTNDFEIQVPLRLPDDELLLITGQQITVSVGIEPIQTSRQFESVAVDVIGLREGLTAVLSPAEVGVLVNGPQPVLSTLETGDVQVLVDLNSIAEPGTFSVTPIASASTQIDTENIEVLPPTIDVQVILTSEANE